MTKPKQRIAPTWAPGYFTALIAEHNWPPRFVPRLGVDARAAQRQRAAEAGRERSMADEVGWGDGTITLNGRKQRQLKRAS